MELREPQERRVFPLGILEHKVPQAHKEPQVLKEE